MTDPANREVADDVARTLFRHGVEGPAHPMAELARDLITVVARHTTVAVLGDLADAFADSHPDIARELDAACHQARVQFQAQTDQENTR